MTIEQLKTVVLIALSSLLLWGYIGEDAADPDKTDKNVEVTETIKLYSNGKLIGEWEGIGRGKMNGNTYTFKTDRGSFSNEMRISGDFIVETDPN